MTHQSHSWALSGKDENLKRYMHSYVHRSTAYKSQDKERIQLSMDRRMAKEDVYI